MLFQKPENIKDHVTNQVTVAWRRAMQGIKLLCSVNTKYLITIRNGGNYSPCLLIMLIPTLYLYMCMNFSSKSCLVFQQSMVHAKRNIRNKFKVFHPFTKKHLKHQNNHERVSFQTSETLTPFMLCGLIRIYVLY